MQGASKPRDVEVLVMHLQQELRRCRGSVRVRRQRKAQDLQYVCQGDELRPQGAPVTIDSMRKAVVSVLKEGHDQLATRSLSLNGLVFLPCEGLVLRDIEVRLRLL